MSKRDERRQRRQQQTRQKQRILIAATVLAAIALTGFAIYQTSQPIGDLVIIEKESLPYADGKALGLAEATVVVQEFSDFQ